MGKDSDAGRDWGQEEKGTTEDEMAGWHLNLWATREVQTSGSFLRGGYDPNMDELLTSMDLQPH